MDDRDPFTGNAESSCPPTEGGIVRRNEVGAPESVAGDEPAEGLLRIDEEIRTPGANDEGMTPGEGAGKAVLDGVVGVEDVRLYAPQRLLESGSLRATSAVLRRSASPPSPATRLPLRTCNRTPGNSVVGL